MNAEDFISTLQDFANQSNIDLIPAGPLLFEMRSKGVETQRRYLLQGSVDEGLVTNVTFSCVCGVVQDSRAYPVILGMNRGGVMGTEFYFSTQEFGQQSHLLLETKWDIEEGKDEQDLFGFLFCCWTAPLFLMEWDFPQGVYNFLW